MRLIISTQVSEMLSRWFGLLTNTHQEPTVIPPVLLDLCTMAIIHRFSSLSWWSHLSNHLAAEFEPITFDTVVRLQVGSSAYPIWSRQLTRLFLKTGEAIIVSPSSLVMKGASARGTLQQLGRRYMLVRMRKRLTADGGKSRLVIEL
jgi:hypothetical protein